LRRTCFTALAAVFCLTLILNGAQALAQTPYKAQESHVQRGEALIELIGPSGFQRVDGLDHDIDETLAAYLPDAGRELAIFAEPKAWKSFYDEIYGTDPSDLAFYATITASDELSEYFLEELDFSLLTKYFSNIHQLRPGKSNRNRLGGTILESGQAAATPFTLISDDPAASITFKTELGQLQDGVDSEQPEFKRRYFAVMSAVLVRGQVVFLNVYTNNRGPAPEEAQALALAWRDEFIKKLTPPEEELI